VSNRLISFWSDLPSAYNNKIEKQSYEDVYLYTPEVNYSSVKFRDKKLDIKWKRSSFKIDVKASKSLNISGIVEDWVFWVWNERKTAKEIEEQIVENRVHPWIIILKETSRCSYQYKEDSLLPVLNSDDPDCSIDIKSFK
jgi:hypothetical protein